MHKLGLIVSMLTEGENLDGMNFLVSPLVCDHREMKLFIPELKSVETFPLLVIYILFDIILSCWAAGGDQTTNSLLLASRLAVL